MARSKEALPAPITFTRALREFLATEVAGGVALVIAAGVALAWANSFWADAYRPLWETDLALRLGDSSPGLKLRRAGITAPPLFVALGVLLWLAVHESGVHATLAGTH